MRQRVRLQLIRDRPVGSRQTGQRTRKEPPSSLSSSSGEPRAKSDSVLSNVRERKTAACRGTEPDLAAGRPVAQLNCGSLDGRLYELENLKRYYMAKHRSELKLGLIKTTINNTRQLRSGFTNAGELYCQLTNRLYATAVG